MPSHYGSTSYGGGTTGGGSTGGTATNTGSGSAGGTTTYGDTTATSNQSYGTTTTTEFVSGGSIPTAPIGMHYMPDGSLMSGSADHDMIDNTVLSVTYRGIGTSLDNTSGNYFKPNADRTVWTLDNSAAVPYQFVWNANTLGWIYYHGDNIMISATNGNPEYLIQGFWSNYNWVSEESTSVRDDLNAAAEEDSRDWNLIRSQQVMTTLNYVAPVKTNTTSSGYRTSSLTNVIYSDIPLTFRVHPNLKDVRPLKDLDAIRQSIKNLVLSNFTDRPFQPQLGANITRLLFEPADTGTALAIKEEVKRVLYEHEPRVTDITIQVFDNMDANAYKINIGYLAIVANTQDETEFYLERLR